MVTFTLNKPAILCSVPELGPSDGVLFRFRLVLVPLDLDFATLSGLGVSSGLTASSCVLAGVSLPTASSLCSVCDKLVLFLF